MSHINEKLNTLLKEQELLESLLNDMMKPIIEGKMIEITEEELNHLKRPKGIVKVDNPTPTKLNAFYYKTRPMGGEDGRHILVWGRLQDAKVVQTTFIEYNSKVGSMKIPVVCDGRLAWVQPTRLTLLEDGGAQPPEEWVKHYEESVKCY